jgi:hypothetical protein
MKNFNWGKGIALAITVFVITTLSVVSYMISLDFFLVTNNHYEEAVDYQETIDKRLRADNLKNPVIVFFDEEIEALRIMFPDDLIGNTQGNIKLYRPNDPSLDTSIPLRINANGTQLITTSTMKKGKWMLSIEWEIDNIQYLEEKMILI